MTYSSTCWSVDVNLSSESSLNITNGYTVTLQNSTINLDGYIIVNGAIQFEGLDSSITLGASGGGTTSISSADSITLTYDNSGNLPSAFGFTYAYDEANRLKNVTKSGTVIEEYFYDANGQRFKKVAGSTTTYYLGKDFETRINETGTYNTTLSNHLVMVTSSPSSSFLEFCRIYRKYP